MIHTIDKSLERFLRDSVPLPEESIDVSFDAPDRTWGAAVTRPTINIFLWEICRNPDRPGGGGMEQRVRNGDVQRRRGLPVVDLHYFVTAWATESADEHQLLGSLISCVLSNDQLPVEVLPDELAESRIRLALSSHDTHMSPDFWSALDGRMKPGLQLELSLPIDAFQWRSASPPAAEIGLTVEPRPAPSVSTAPTGDTAAESPPAAGHPLRRHRSGGSLVMEGRADNQDSGP